MNIPYIKVIVKKNELLLQVFLLIILNYFSTKYLYQSLPSEQVYAQNSIFYSFLHYSPILFGLIILTPLFLYRFKWEEFADNSYIKIKYFILFIFSIYAWGIITLDYNLYFDQAYHLDRIVLLVLFALSFRFPVAFVYFMIFSLLFFNQVSYPSFECDFPRNYVYTKPLLEILILFIVFMFVKRVYKQFSILVFLIVVICFHASNYFIPGLGKVLLGEQYIDWIWVNDLSNIFVAKYSQGWLATLLSIEQLQVIVKWISAFSVPMQLFTLIIQTIVLFVFINKRFTLILFISFELLHLGIFMASGIFFWRWILLNLSIIYIINSLDMDEIKKVFNAKIMLFAMPFIFLGFGFFHSYWLAWYDTPLNNFHKVYATAEDGERYEIDNNLFAPYDRAFYRNTLNCFIDAPLKSRWDTTHRDVMKELTTLSHQENMDFLKDEVFKFEQKYGQNEFDIKEQEKSIAFFKVFFKNLNNYQNQKIIWNEVSPMRNMYRLFDWDSPLNKSSKIVKIEVVFYKNFYSHRHNKLLFLEEKSLVEVNIEQ